MRQRHESEVHRCVTAKSKLLNLNSKNKKKKRAQQKHNGVQNVIDSVLLGGRDMRAMVMPLWSCGYTVMLTSLRESFMEGEEREMARSRREKETTDKSQHQENITATCFIFS